MNTNKNERKKPFSLSERELFLNIMQQHTHILSCKQNDAMSAIKKKRCWEKIKQEFNSSSIVTQPASIKQLTKFWYNMKAKVRDPKIRENDCFLSGDGPKHHEISINKIDDLKYRILEEELDFKRKLHAEELRTKKIENEYKEKILQIELEIKEQQLKK